MVVWLVAVPIIAVVGILGGLGIWQYRNLNPSPVAPTTISKTTLAKITGGSAITLTSILSTGNTIPVIILIGLIWILYKYLTQ